MNKLAVNFSAIENMGGSFKFTGGNANIASVINAIIPYIFIIAGIGLILYILAGGFAYIFSRGDPKKTQAASSNITNAVIGFVIIFLAYWIVKILGTIFGIDTFGGVF